MMLKRSFAPVVDEHTRVLVLGSLPGEASLAQGQYYAHRQNRFWHLIGDVIGEDLPRMAYEARLQALLYHRVGLWDVIAEARREGSLDSRIRDHATNDLATLVAGLPSLAAVAFNGGTAAKIGMQALAESRMSLDLIRLPSSSPAYAAVPYSEKLRAWEALRKWLPV
ncbi:DNA-deoxyinosine glycosylase [Trinickia symbiotica]|uniref:DNA-deoxyinosine glycosylase n=1 Tax=Trinickia symbiotica TaxID=863227 RepID=A0A2T3XSB5_9BURK|nr:DNA-deoxyinosine glycosylase [Trinickia symbiotica]PTB19419.1 DNA-deoxyinosine glycosylase [Trinickia symbiotica]